jgi:HEAT repeat protein
VRESAWHELYGNLVHQGDVYQATSYAVPFLLHMLGGEAVPGRADLLAYLEAIVTGVPHLTERHTWMDRVLAEQGRDFQAEIALARAYAERAHAAVSEGLETYLGLMDHPNPDVRERAFNLLLAFPEQAGRIVPALLARLEAEEEPELRARLIEQLGLSLPAWLPLGRHVPVTKVLEDLVRPGETPMVRFAAAVALARIAGEAVPSIALEALVMGVAQAVGLYPEPGRPLEPAAAEGYAVELACSALGHVGADRRIPVLARVLSHVTVPARAHQVALLLLDSALLGLARTVDEAGTPEADAEAIGYAAADGEARTYPRAERPLEVEVLTPIQRAALQAVLDSPPVWALPSNLLELYGLPASHEVARGLLRPATPGATSQR